MRPKASISRADLLWGFAAVDKEQRQALAELLGFEEKVDKKQLVGEVTLNIQPISHTSYSTTLNLEVPEHVNSKRNINLPAYYRITKIQRDPNAEQNEKQDLRPEWLQHAKPDYFSKTELSIPQMHRRKPQYQPLVTWARLWPFLYQVLGAEKSSSKADLNKLVEQVAAGKVIRQVLRLLQQTWAEFAHILIDINEKNFPFRNDFFYLCQQLQHLRGEYGLDIQYVDDMPGGDVLRYQSGQAQRSAWQNPGANNPLLILSDLGMHAQSRRTLYDWLVFGQQLKQHGCRPVVLMPVAARDLDPRLLQYFTCVVWDRASQLKSLSLLPVQTSVPSTSTPIDLLTYFAAAVRVDTGLVRAIRHLLSVQYDIGHEVALWQNTAVHSVNEQWAWQVDRRIEHLQKLAKAILQLPSNKQQQLLKLMGQYHALLPEELYFEMMATFLQIEELRRLLPAEVQAATQAFMANLIKTYVVNSEHQGFNNYAQRYLARHDNAQCRATNKYTHALYVFATARQASNTQIEWPKDIKLADVHALLSIKQQAKTYLLRQQGQHLQLISKALLQQNSNDWEIGVTLASLLLTQQQIGSLQFTSNGEQHANVEMGELIDLGILNTGVYQLQVGQGIFSIEASLPLERAPWVFTQAMSVTTGSYVESQDQQGNVYRWYWHLPSWHQKQGALRGVWYSARPKTSIIPTWAESGGRDQYGIYADINVKGVELRMRWIEPGTFLMGSPENEAERHSWENQHQVTLTQGYWLADSTVTQELWVAVMGENPSHFKGDNLPVERVSWENAQTFITKLNKLQPLLHLCLPSEAQWEYACRAGTVTPFYFGDNISPEQVNYDGTEPYAKGKEGEYRQQTVPVKSLVVNSWGLYEMHGNVWEWCQDTWQAHLTESALDPLVVDSSDSRVVRGGSWNYFGWFVRSAMRSLNSPAKRFSNTGFRLARGHQAQPDRKSKSIPSGSLDRRVPEQRQSKLLDGIGKLLRRK
ncbi:MAG: formylglycine-generating enzyme [Methyloprofundus sp.]|nr:MAG: formylglycine-generating enzyme [Methyloprofundus sp.]